MSQPAAGPEVQPFDEGNRDPAARLHAVLDAWRPRLRSTAASEPRMGDRGAREEALVRVLLEATDASPADGDASLRAVVLSAAAYGRDQPSGRVDPGSLCIQLAELRQVIWDELKATAPPKDAGARILRLDRALVIVLRACVSGSCRAELEQRGQWPEALNAILSETPDPK
jgi:hypothetical protein